MPTLKENVFQKYEKLAGPLREDFEETQIERIYQVLCDMPTLDVGLCVIGQQNDESDAVQKITVPMKKDDWIKIHQSEVCKINFFFLNKHFRTVTNKFNIISRSTRFKRISIDTFIVLTEIERRTIQSFQKFIAQNFRKSKMKVGF